MERVDQTEPLGLSLRATLQLRIPQEVILKLIPLTVGVVLGSTGIWFNYMTQPTPALPTTADVQPPK